MKYVKVEEIKGYEGIRINIGTEEESEMLDSKTALRMFAVNSEPGEDVEAWVKVQKVIESIGKAELLRYLGSIARRFLRISMRSCLTKNRNRCVNFIRNKSIMNRGKA